MIVIAYMALLNHSLSSFILSVSKVGDDKTKCYSKKNMLQLKQYYDTPNNDCLMNAIYVHVIKCNEKNK